MFPRKLTVTVELYEDDARDFLEVLNEDDGLRTLAVERLLAQHTAPAIARRTRCVSVLGTISAAIHATLEIGRLWLAR